MTAVAVLDEDGSMIWEPLVEGLAYSNIELGGAPTLYGVPPLYVMVFTCV